MADIGTKIRAEFSRVMKDIVLSDGILKAAGKAAAATANELIRRRTMLGYDRKGQKFKSYSKGYTYKKSSYIKGAPTAFNKSYSKTDFAADKVRDVGRLSGRFFQGMGYKNVQVKRSGSSVSLSWSLTLSNTKGPKGSPSPLAKAGLLKYNGYDIYGLSTSGAFKAKEEKEILTTIRRILRFNPGASGKITDL